MTLAGLLLLILTLDHPPEGGWGFRGFPALFALAAGTVGWLIMVRRPENRIGLLLSAIGLFNGAQLFLTEYSASGLRMGLPASNVAAWVNAFIWVPTFALMAGGIAFLFPDGHPPSRAWRPAGWLMVVGSVALMAIIAVYPDAVSTPRDVRPIITVPIADTALNTASFVALGIVAAGIILAAVSLIRRWLRATGVVREQIKWLALSAVLVVATMPLSIIPGVVPNAVFIVAIGTIPLAVGIAVLRYRLYEIDAVISRTLVYGALTAILTGAFAALQKVLQTVFVSATGNESDAATIITTLVLATSFAPLKKGIEKIVERRAGSSTRSDADAAASTAAPATPADDLERLLRRVVREELAADRRSAGSTPDRN